MIVRHARLPWIAAPSPPRCVRCLHAHIAPRKTPSPTPFVPDPHTFLTLIGRSLSQHAAKIPSWEALFSLTSQQLHELGVEPARSRRYLLHWRDRFRRSLYGIGGDLTEVTNGVGEVQVMEIPNPRATTALAKPTGTLPTLPGKKKVIINVPQGSTALTAPLDRIKPVKGLKLVGAHTISGPHVELVKGTQGSRATIAVKEGLWEERRGHKIDGGERRKAEVRAKRRSEERKANK